MKYSPSILNKSDNDNLICEKFAVLKSQFRSNIFLLYLNAGYSFKKMQAYCIICIGRYLLGKPLKGCCGIYRCVEYPKGTILFDLQTILQTSRCELTIFYVVETI